jgi:hypothetical protein
VGDVEEDRLIKLSPKIESKRRRAYELFGAFGCPDCGTELTRPSKKREPQAAGDTKILPMELQVGDRIMDETGEWEVQHSWRKDRSRARPENRRARQLGDSKLDASKRISVVRASPEEGKG